MTKTVLPLRDICTVGIFTALTAILSQISIPLPFTPIPFSFGLMAVYITAILLRPSAAVFAQFCYLLLGAVGLPVYSGMRGGLAALFGPTGGYLMVYPIMAAIVSLALNGGEIKGSQDSREKRMLACKGAVAMLIAHTLLYIGGSLWLSFTTGNSLSASLALAVYPFIPLDLVKIAFCILCVLPLRERMIRMGFLTGKKQP